MTMKDAASRAHAIVASQGGSHAGSPWDEAKHPRHPAGSSEGGEFAADGGVKFGAGATVKKGKDFSFDGEYHVTFMSGKTSTIYFDRNYRNWETLDKNLAETNPYSSAVHTGRIWAFDKPTLLARLDAHYSHGYPVERAMRLERYEDGRVVER